MTIKKVFEDAELSSDIRSKLRTENWRRKLSENNISLGKLAEKLDKVDEIGVESVLDGFFDYEEEAIILLLGRPAIPIQNNTFTVTDTETNFWRDKLESFRNQIEIAIPLVGRIELENHDSFDWVGSAWAIDKNIIVTNRHVALYFSQKQGDGFHFRAFNQRVIKALIDFREEFSTPPNPIAEQEIEISDILYVTDSQDGQPDIAFLRLANDLPSSIDLSTDEVQNGSDVAIIGYPSENSYTSDPVAVRKIFGNIYKVKMLLPGKVVNAQEQRIDHDCSTLGGNSGSVLLDIQTGKAIGIHFGGRYKIANYAVPAKVIQKLLDEKVN